WNSDYESLLSLAAQLGEVKPRCTPDNVIDSLESAVYKDWNTPDSDHRCPICLDDYLPDDPVLKLSGCSHWLHSECLRQWLRSATTCPVCREAVVGPAHRTSFDSSNEAGPSQRRGPRDGPGGSGSSESGGEGASGAAGSSSGLSALDPRRPRRFL
ncbi:RING finger protein 38, partial [Termitomyces sp. T112]